jgi:AcrR family transcriptional regulator
MDNPKAVPWLKEGKKRFAQNGISGLNILEMSKWIRVAKTSFYFLFKSKDEYFKQLLKYWVEDGTNRVINTVAVIDDPHARFRKLMELALNNIENDKFLFHLRGYAQNNAYAANVLKDLENSRLNYLTKIFTEMGYTRKVAKKKAYDVYFFYLGFFEYHKHNGISSKMVKETVDEIIIHFKIKH